MVVYQNILYFELWIKSIAFLSVFNATLELVLAYQLSWLDLNILFYELGYLLICFASFKKLFIKIKQDCYSVTCHFWCLFLWIGTVFANKQSSSVKISNLYEWWKFTLKTFTSFDSVVILIRYVKCRPDFQNDTELNGLENSFF